MAAAWRAYAGAWKLDDKIVHLADPLPPVRDLVAMLMSDYTFRLLTGTCRDPGDASWLVAAVLSGRLPPALLDDIADALTEQWFAQPRWTVQRLWREALGTWREIDADLITRGVDVLALEPDRATHAVYGALHRRRAHDQAVLSRWLKDLAAPPQRALARDESAAADWFAAAGMLGAPLGLIEPAGVDSELTVT